MSGYEEDFHADKKKVKEAWDKFNEFWDGLDDGTRENLTEKEAELDIKDGKIKLRRTGESTE